MFQNHMIQYLQNNNNNQNQEKPHMNIFAYNTYDETFNTLNYKKKIIFKVFNNEIITKHTLISFTKNNKFIFICK